MNSTVTNTYNDKKYNDYMSQHNLKNIESNYNLKYENSKNKTKVLRFLILNNKNYYIIK